MAQCIDLGTFWGHLGCQPGGAMGEDLPGLAPGARIGPLAL